MARNFMAYKPHTKRVHLFSEDYGLSRCGRYWMGDAHWSGNAEDFVRTTKLRDNQYLCPTCEKNRRKPQEKP